MHPAPIRNCGNPKEVSRSEEGYVILAAIFFMTLLVLSLTIAAPIVAKSIQRDRDVETFHRGMQYRRAIQLYYRKFHAYPPNMDALVNTNQIHFLRKKYADPITAKNDWKPVMFGQNKAPTALGFSVRLLLATPRPLRGLGRAAVPVWPAVVPWEGSRIPHSGRIRRAVPRSSDHRLRASAEQAQRGIPITPAAQEQ